LVVLGILHLNILLFGQPLPTGAVAYYPFNGNANDESGNANHGFANGTILMTDRFGRANSAMYFGGNGFIKGSAATFPTGDRTISVWVNRENTTATAQCPFAYGGGQTCGTSLYMALDNNTFRTSSHCNVNTQNYTDATFANNSWKHWVIVVSGQTLKTYLNGVEVANSVFTGTTNVASTNFGIGTCVNQQGSAPFADAIANVGYFKGKLDDIRVYGRALTAAEIGELYREPNPLIVNSLKTIIKYYQRVSFRRNNPSWECYPPSIP
jgi:hypothetical protein